MATKSVKTADIARLVLGKLKHGNRRVVQNALALRWFPWPDQPDFVEGLMAEMGVSSDPPDGGATALEQEFDEEVQAIRSAIEELGFEPKLADWQKGSFDAAHRLMLGLNMGGMAMAVWDQIGIPVRRRGNRVYRLWAPSDVMGRPMIKSMHIDAWMRWFVEEFAQQQVCVGRLTRYLRFCLGLAVVLVIALCAIIIHWFF